MAVTTALTMPQRTALNVTYRQGSKGSWPNLLCAYPGVDLDVVYDLVDRCLLTGPARDDVEYGRLYDARFHLAAAGREWVRTDPLTRLLNSLWSAPKRALRLDKAAAAGGEDLIREVVDGGYATLHYGGDLRQTEFKGDGAHEFRHARDFLLIGTLKIRNVLG